MLLLFPFPVMTFPSHKYTTSNYSHAKMTWYFKNANHHETWWLFLLLKILLNLFQRLHDNTIKYICNMLFCSQRPHFLGETTFNT